MLWTCSLCSSAIGIKSMNTWITLLQNGGLAAITVDDFSAEELMGGYLPASSVKTPKLIIR